MLGVVFFFRQISIFEIANFDRFSNYHLKGIVFLSLHMKIFLNFSPVIVFPKVMGV